MTAGVCRVCGCTDDRPCELPADAVDLVDGLDLLFEGGPSTCSWVEPDLCSACQDDVETDGQAGDAPLLVDAYGVPWRGKGS